MHDWITAIPFSEWPQQAPLNGEMRPAMVNDPLWHDFEKNNMDIMCDILDYAPECNDGNWSNCMLSVVMPGHFIASHKDEQPDNWLYRVHVPITTNLSVFMITDRAYHLEVGSAYRVDTRQLHAIVNHGDTPRIHFMFDVMGD
jgi:Aspartyl/Asparaginyl beta-hydroxylase